ncbi:hypothetical protein Pfo_012012 [Paulownia fortunei]|nr:hypothetical protein Pfo_012012 [Paulownia fortunei]
MDMSGFNDTQVSTPTDSGGKNTFDNRPPSRIRNQQSTSVHSIFDFKKPRFSERNWYPRIPLSVNRSKLSIPYKSELCLLFQRGRCHYGENCHFSHSMSEIRKPGFNTVAMEEQLKEDSKRNAVCKMRECYWFSGGIECPYGDKCQFLHKCDQKVRRDVGLYRESYAVSAMNGVSDRSGSDQVKCRSLNAGEDYDKLDDRKTKLCIKWERFGCCPYGVKCIYAHGKAELQERGSHAELECGYISRSRLASQPNNAVTCEVGTKTAKKLQLKGKGCFMKWKIEKISQIYADWMDDRHNFHASLSRVGT